MFKVNSRHKNDLKIVRHTLKILQHMLRFIVNFEHISQLFLVFLLLIVNRQMFAAMEILELDFVQMPVFLTLSRFWPMRSTYFNCRYILEISIFLHRFDSTQVKQISFFLKLGSTTRKTEQPLQGMESQEKEEEKYESHIRKPVRSNLKINGTY